ncbi:MAG: polyphosphate kinase 2 family protein [Ignavibacterium sp.]
MNIKNFLAPYQKFSLEDFPTKITDQQIKNKQEAKNILQKNIKEIFKLQSKLYAEDKYALLLILQGMDTAGKDSMIKNVMSGLNPQGTQVFSFKQPSQEELDHDYLWRIKKAVPERGRIGIFNRSHYEDVLIVRVHNLLDKRKLPLDLIKKNIWEQRFEQIKYFEKYLYQNGIITIKFFLHISKEEQKKRLLKRLDIPSKNWKFSSQDIEERKYWNDYQNCYNDAIKNTSTKYAPWYVIPSDEKWFARLIVSEIIIHHLKKLNLNYPSLNEEQKENLNIYKKQLIKG